jgi:signal transduction histidine kinase/ligand-binding sensor domain-containing protein/DNA-binding response OmpR family regulator
MYYHKLIYILSIFLIQASITAPCAGNELHNATWSVSQITNESGLSNSAVNAIYKDTRGFVWFGTWDGLNKYDGTTIVTFYPESFKENSISNNIIWEILEDSEQNLWVVTERGINLYNQELNQFKSWFSTPEYMPAREKSLRACVGPDGSIWLAVYGEGLFRFAPGDNEFDPVPINWPRENLNQNITGIFTFDSIVYLLHETLEISSISPTGYLLRNHDYIPSEHATKPRADLNWFFSLNKQPFMAVACQMGGLWLSDINNNTTSLIRNEGFESLVTALQKVESEGYVLLGTDDGNIFRLDPQKGYQQYSLLEKLPDLRDKRVKIWSILYTADDLLWVGTDGEGVYQFNSQPKPFYNIAKGNLAHRQINHQIVRAVYEDADGNVWIGTRGNGLNMIPAEGGPTRIFNTENGLSNDAVLSLAEDMQGNLWIGLDGPGVDILNKTSGDIFHFPDDLKGGEELDFGSVYTICVDVFGTVWLGTSGNGVYGLTIDPGKEMFRLQNFIHLPGKGGKNDLKGNIVFAIREEKPNILWIGARMGGLHRFNTLTGEIQFFGQGTPDEPGLNNPDILSLLIGTDKHLWIGTSGGLNTLNLAGGTYNFIHYSVRDGLPNHTIHGILEDREGNIWVSTNKGLSRYLRTEKRFINYDSGDGLLNNEFTDGAAFHHQSSGRFYFGGINGADWFYPKEISISVEKPKVVLTGFRLYNQTIYPGDESGVLPKNIDFMDEITLRHNQNFFGVEFATLNYNNAPKTSFAYKLENFNIDWVDLESQREAIFTNVPHGNYRLLVRATNEDGFWSDQVRSLNIVIKPPAWLTYYAYTAYLLAFILLGFLFYRYQSNRITRRQQLVLEKLNQQKEKELNQYKFEFFTNLAHEFRTPLTLIFASAASLFDKVQDAHPHKPLLRTVYINARRLQRMIEELLAFQKLDTGRERLDLQKGDLVGFVAEITEIFSHYAHENEVELSFEPEESRLITSFDGEKIERILLNLLSNAIKYTPSGGSVKTRLGVESETIIIEVIDTGCGISFDVLPHIFDRYYQQASPHSDLRNIPKGSGIGLTYTKSLVELLGGSIDVESHPGMGSRFTVQLPMVKDEARSMEPAIDIQLKGREQLLESIAEDYFHQYDDVADFKPQATLARNQPSKYRILIAEDDVQLLQLLQNLLSQYYDVSTAQNGVEALDMLKSKRIDLVVSDVIMPVMDGLTLCKAIKDDFITSHIPVVLLTARSETEQLIEGLEKGADAYIAKPFHPRHLFVTIKKLISSREKLISQIRKDIEQSVLNENNHLPERDHKLLKKAFSFVESNYHLENLNADQLADHLAMSKAQLYRKIKAITGVTPHGLIKNYRLNKAREMIAEGKFCISDIIYMTGFNNRTYFYRSYRELFGETPGEITKRAKVKPETEK